VHADTWTAPKGGCTLTAEVSFAGERGSVQPGGRQPAPGPLALVQGFVNSHYDLVFEHGAEVLHSPSALARWLADCDLLVAGAELTVADLERTLAFREALRGLARETGDGGPCASTLERLNRAAAGAAAEVRLTPSGPRFVPPDGARVSGAIGVLLAIVATSMREGTWARLKICPGEDCGWAFYDNSRNRAGRWCSMSVCGGRAKARSHYRRRRVR
jgi:predicted RNA-binding Zn ribbon-like protein